MVSKKHIHICILVFIITALCIIYPGSISSVSPVAKAAVRNNILQLSQAKDMALRNSKDYKKIKNQLTLQGVKYIEAVKSVQLKKKNMSTFRWTPILNFKFPEEPDLVEAYEFIYKPLQVQTKIASLTNQLDDVKYEIYETVSLLYTNIYIDQQKIQLLKEVLSSSEEELQRNQAKLLLGKANQQDIDRMEKSIEAVKSNLALMLRSFETSKSELTDLIKLDVTTGYTFKNPLITAKISRDNLNALVSYTLEQDQTYFDAKLDSKACLTSLTTYESLMKSKYGSYMNYIQSYVDGAKNGKTVDYEAFKTKYDEMLKAIDAPWQGNIKILFIKIPKEWFKGELDGVRYVDDEPYALYTASMEYEEAAKTQEKTKQAITKNVNASFEAIVTAKNAYDDLEVQTKDLEVELSRLSELNKLGKAEYSEVKDASEEYQSSQMDTIESLSDYSQLLYSFDRLTCGGITKLLRGEVLTTGTGAGADSYVSDGGDGVSYYIESKVEDEVFVFGINVPKDFEPEITHYELWNSGVRIGEKTAKDKQIIHLTLTNKNTQTITVRLYNGDKFVGDCQIDPAVTTGKLNIGNGTTAEQKTTKTVGTYKLETDTAIGMTYLSLSINKKEDIQYYTVANSEGKNLFSDEPIAIDKSFTYLSMLAKDIGSLIIKLYDGNQELVYSAVPEEKTQSLTVEITN